MKHVEYRLVKTIANRLKELETNVYAVEKQNGLPSDAIRNVLRPREGSKSGPTYSRVAEICDVLGLELYVGPPREITPAPEVDVDGQRFATIVRHDATAAAGGGYVNFDNPPVDHLAFSKTWLRQNGIQAGSCSLINAFGESMEPSIWDGDLIMIDHRKTEISNRRVYVYNDPENGTRVKRLELSDGVIAVHSDNPDKQEFPTEYHTGDAMNAISQNIVGQVVWSGHKWN